MKDHLLNKRHRQRKGFTLIELLVVIVIIAILALLALPRLADMRNRAREAEVASNLRAIQTALEAFGTDNSSNYPFRVRWFDNATYQDPNFDPYVATDTGTGLHSDSSNWFSLGLFGGVRVVTDTFQDNTVTPVDPMFTEWKGMKEHIVIQPSGWTYGFYRIFNQYSDPLVALGYLDEYPPNPFLKRPMGNIMWSFGDANWDTGGLAVLDKTIPHEDTVETPRDFVYTFFYSTDGTEIFDPEGVVEAKKSYQAETHRTTQDGMYYLDVIDSYHLWAYGVIPMNGPTYIAYPNNSLGLAARGLREAKKDFDGSGTKDLYELGMIAYFKRTTTSSQASDAGGSRVEF